MGSEPIVFWMSKARSVVGQTLVNFSSGKYRDIVSDFRVISVQGLTPALIADASTPLMVLATTGLFNNKDQSEGALNIYKKSNDQFGDRSPWQHLIDRSKGSERRPLIVVYDEGHNLSEQQTDLLGELEPDAYLLASATLKLPLNFQKSVIQPITLWVEETSAEVESFKALQAVDSAGVPEAEQFTTTAVLSAKVVEAELVKKAIQFDGTTAAMESCLDDLIGRLTLLQTEISARSLGFKPKAIYVCKTNIADDGEKDDASKPFEHRGAPPIRIWRYLVEQKGIKPKDIAIYANLTFQSGGKPVEVNLFSKGENDFDAFTAGDYRHIIFNLALQEGWDDPACYLAYIDKSMGSTVQVEQVIGRVLRQYGAKHYNSALLNTAHFFLRVDKQSVFTEAIEKVKSKLQSEGSPIEITSAFGKSGGSRDLSPKTDIDVDLHNVFVDSEAARQAIVEIIADFPVFTAGDGNTAAEAKSATTVVDLKNLNAEASATKWKPDGTTNPVRLRWLANVAIKGRSSRALAITDLSDPKFDVRVQVQSKAEKLVDQLARDVVSAFYQHSDLVYEPTAPFQFGVIRVPKTAQSFTNGLYDSYGGLNKFEVIVANAIDELDLPWHRNPSSGGFHIPLLSEGDSASFYPDFLVWKGKDVFCIDSKGGHLLSDAVARKLFDIKVDGKNRIHVRFVSEGKQAALRAKVTKGGYTVWKMKSGSPKPIYLDSIDKALAEAMK